MTFRLSALAAAAFSAMTLSAAALADEGHQPYDADAFADAQAANAPILIDVYAAWCPTCRAQAPVIESLLQREDFPGLRVFRVDYDGQRAVSREFGARRQSTLIVFRGETETGRSVGVTDPARIEALVATAYAD